MEKLNTTLALSVLTGMIIEGIVSAKENWANYSRKDTLTNLGIATISGVLNFLLKGAFVWFFFLLYSLTSLRLSNQVWTWMCLFLLVDLHYYLFHWLGHKSRFFWAMHVIHHSSKTYNLTTALRSPFTNTMFRFGTLGLIALMGFNPLHILFINNLIGVVTFFQHTELVRKLGWLEFIFITPSHHRVHHASDAKYIDKNFGGVLLLWDKLFGTFQMEEEHPTYGLTKPLSDGSIVNVITHEWKDMIRDVRSTNNGYHQLMYLFGKPGWRPAPSGMRVSYGFLSLPKLMLISVTLLLLSTAQLNAQPTLCSVTVATVRKVDRPLWKHKLAAGMMTADSLVKQECRRVKEPTDQKS